MSLRAGATHLLLLCGIVVTLVWWFPPAPVTAQAPTRTPPMGADMERLAAPEMPEHPTQADEGAYEYYLRCMACHGDRGQGLTEEWRAAWGPEEQNCWQSKCHAGPLPPGSFEMPQHVPALIGGQTLVRFKTAAEVQQFICEQMPWHAPATLEDDTCWQLTAYLLRENGHPVESMLPLEPENAADLQLRGSTAQTEREAESGWRSGFWLLPLGILILLGLGMLRYRRTGRSDPAT